MLQQQAGRPVAATANRNKGGNRETVCRPPCQSPHDPSRPPASDPVAKVPSLGPAGPGSRGAESPGSRGPRWSLPALRVISPPLGRCCCSGLVAGGAGVPHGGPGARAAWVTSSQGKVGNETWGVRGVRLTMRLGPRPPFPRSRRVLNLGRPAPRRGCSQFGREASRAWPARSTAGPASGPSPAHGRPCPPGPPRLQPKTVTKKTGSPWPAIAVRRLPADSVPLCFVCSAPFCF